MKLFMSTIKFLFYISLLSCSRQEFVQQFESKDILNFWSAYDKIVQTNDSLKQLKYINELYINRASQGLKDIINARNYTNTEFINSIKSYPEFWKSIRETTLNTDKYHKEITEDVAKLKNVYPDFKHSKIYFTMGAFRTGGTYGKSTLLIGSEMALGNETTKIQEFSETRQSYYTMYKPLKNLALLCTHEYIHLQQKHSYSENLLSLSVFEGSAEYISCYVTGKPSNTPSIPFGQKNKEAIRKRFIVDWLQESNQSNWFWGVNRNELKVNELGYYVGYAISEGYIKQSDDKNKAIKELIELDYTNKTELHRVVNASKFFSKPVEDIISEFKDNRPIVAKIKEFENGSQNVDPNVNKITVIFSKELNGINDGLDFGPKGRDFYPKVDNNSRKFGAQNKSYSFNVNLKPKTSYQMVIGSNFRLKTGVRLTPYVIEFKTK